MAKPNDYVDNEEFVKQIVAYKERLKNNPEERVPEYIGKCLLDIATGFASKPNFFSYSYRDEMIADGIENCLRYLTNFDPSKSSNAFAYYTQICFFAFIRRIAKEKKESYVKHKLILDMPFEAFDQQSFDDNELSQSFVSYVQSYSSFDHESFEKNLIKKAKKAKSKKTPLEDLLGDENEIS